MVFGGVSQHSFDEKGRLILPARFRDSFNGQCMLNKDQEPNVCIYPMEAWLKLEEKLKTLNTFKKRERDFLRWFYSNSDECPIDKQGRMLINQEFRSHGNLTKEVYLIGVRDHLEIWDKKAWEDYRGGLDKACGSVAEDLFE